MNQTACLQTILDLACWRWWLRLLDSKLVARARPDEPVMPRQFGPEPLAGALGEYGTPPGGWTNCSALRAVARLGGFLARAGDGEPGWQTIWRGWQRLITMCKGYPLAGRQP